MDPRIMRIEKEKKKEEKLLSALIVRTMYC